MKNEHDLPESVAIVQFDDKRKGRQTFYIPPQDAIDAGLCRDAVVYEYKLVGRLQ